MFGSLLVIFVLALISSLTSLPSLGVFSERSEPTWHKGTDIGAKVDEDLAIVKGLRRLKDLGFHPKHVLDVGANVGEWSRVVKLVYPDTEVYMIEGSQSCAPSLNNTGNWYTISLVGKENSEVEFFERPKGTGNSIFKENSKHFSSIRPVLRPIRTLDLLMSDQPSVQMLKLDIQGAELDALKGSHRILKGVEVVVLEISILEYNQGAPLALDTLAYLNELGFDMLDLLDFHHLGSDKNSFIFQIDVVLARKSSSLFKRKEKYLNNKK